MIVWIKRIVMLCDGYRQAEEHVEYALMYVLTSLGLGIAYDLKTFKSRDELMMWLDMNVPDVDFYKPRIWVKMPIGSFMHATANPTMRVVEISKLNVSRDICNKILNACDAKIYDDNEKRTKEGL